MARVRMYSCGGRKLSCVSGGKNGDGGREWFETKVTALPRPLGIRMSSSEVGPFSAVGDEYDTRVEAVVNAESSRFKLRGFGFFLGKKIDETRRMI
jgi:hypothetical protein